ncbi:hypothetical protein QQ045_010719 [Rhodiola kirilowii]
MLIEGIDLGNQGVNSRWKRQVGSSEVLIVSSSSWELLPEANYSKSGYELEMEAEAKNSEEENEEGSTTKQFNGINIKDSFGEVLAIKMDGKI